LTSTHEDMSDNVALTPPIASSSRVETAEKTTSMISKEEPSSVTSSNLQASRSPRGQICQTSSSRARTIFNDTQGEATEELSSLFKEKPTVIFVNSQTSSSHDQIHQIPSHTRTNYDVQGKVKEKKESILMTVAESSMPLDSKIEIVEELNPTTPVDCLSSSMIMSADTTIVAKTNLSTKVTNRVT